MSAYDTPPYNFGKYWDEILDNKNALIKHLMDENNRLEKENEKLKKEHLA